MSDLNTRYTDEGVKLTEVRKYIIDTTKEHMLFFGMVNNYIRYRDNIQTDYMSMLDSILGTAYRLINGDMNSKTAEDLEFEIINEYFSQTLPQNALDSIHQCIIPILEYYTKTLLNLNLSTDRVMYLNDINNKRIVISEFNIEHLIDKE